MEADDARFKQAAEAIRSADALLIGAGAGMGVDSGLPDFRGPEGFWKAYPPFHGMQFHEMSNPRWFRRDPALAWGFFGHRLNLYRSAVPHEGFAILRQWIERAPLGGFVFTSNVDGQFQEAGFADDAIVECHGSIHHLQCTADCGHAIWPTGDTEVVVDAETIRAKGSHPSCPKCGALARPNILMFDDGDWDSTRARDQFAAYAGWLDQLDGKKIVSIELGAGLTIPTVRYECERRAEFVVRINPRDTQPPRNGVALAVGAREGLERIDRLL
jgi:NAD-dependent SIR2 family protein deacetylase